MSYRIEYEERGKDQNGGHFYYIYDDERLIARFWHDHRGDAFEVEPVFGDVADCPFQRLTDVMQGGGPQPLTLTDEAIAYFEKRKLSGRADPPPLIDPRKTPG